MAEQPPKNTRRDSRESGGGPNRRPDQPPPPNMRMSRSLLMWTMLVALALLLFFVLNSKQPGQALRWDEFETLYKQGSVDPDSVVLRHNGIFAELRENTGNYAAGPVRVPYSQVRDPYIERLDKLTGGAWKDDARPSLWPSLLIGLLPWILIFAVIWFFLFRGLRSAGGGAGMFGSFGRSRHRLTNKEHTNITFADVAGIEEAKDELTEIVEFLKNPKKFQRLGARIPRGVLLSGPPGCGKTLLAKAIAGEADVPFFSISGSDFVEMFVGVGASRVRDLFKQAKENNPCIIFLDEIDAVGRKRGSGFATGGNDEREQTLNAILVEMDGFETSDQVIVIAATNRADVLDPALTRPGRFDRSVIVSLPDLKGRTEILKVHSRKVKLAPTVDLERTARGTPMFSGADLAAIINEAAIIATLAGKDYVDQDDLDEARDKIKFGRARKSRVIEEKEKIATAYHEAGHAVVQSLLPDADPLHKVTIIPRGQFGGATFSLPEKDRYGFGLKYLQATLRVMCGGRIAEEIMTGDVSSGAAQDIAQVTSFARMMVLEWGMSKRLGFIRYADDDGGDFALPGKPYSDETARVIDEEVKRLSDEAYVDCERLIRENWSKVEAVADALLKYETLSADEVHRLMRGDTIDKPTVSDLLAAEHRKKRAAGESVPGKGAKSASKEGDEPESGVLPRPA
ncbi:MAG: ATP-dependent zinc metalloprotease FtsH [Phycisphaerales bacterium]|nr:ATP-dependent zinc metalloprotease FtsH [Phycisphaerales bacterium]